MTWFLTTFPAPLWLSIVVLLVVAVGAFVSGQLWAVTRAEDAETAADVANAAELRAAFDRGVTSGRADVTNVVRNALAEFPTSLGGRAIARAVGLHVPKLVRTKAVPEERLASSGAVATVTGVTVGGRLAPNAGTALYMPTLTAGAEGAE